jgi:YD repeat-containing protein
MPILSFGSSIGYEYEPTGLQRRITYPNGSVATFVRGGDGRVRRVAGLVDEIDYDGVGRLSRMLHANGIEEAFGYTDAGHLATMQFSGAAGTLHDAALTHDADGRLARVLETSGPDPIEEVYEHNALGQLTRFVRQWGAATTAWDYEADADGNLFRASEMQTAQFEYDFAAPGALTRRTLNDATVETFTFDAAGHMTEWGASVLEWDARGAHGAHDQARWHGRGNGVRLSRSARCQTSYRWRRHDPDPVHRGVMRFRSDRTLSLRDRNSAPPPWGIERHL